MGPSDTAKIGFPACFAILSSWAVLLAGCVSSLEDSATLGGVESAGERYGGAKPFVVVGMVDDGVSFYHEAFNRTADSTEIQEYVAQLRDARTGSSPIRVDFSRVGDLQERLAADYKILGSLERNKLYWFAGTNVLGVSVVEPGEGGRQRLFVDGGTHGTETASTLVATAPNVLIVMVEASLSASEDPPQVFSSSLIRGLQWLANQPWIDVVSLSLGTPGNLPFPERSEVARLTKQMVESGKIVVAANGNYPTPGVLGYYQGPPWLISVGGADERTRGETAIAGKVPDVVSNYTQFVADPATIDGYHWRTGTSYGTPIVAGVIGDALLRIREAAAKPANAEDRGFGNPGDRHALNAAIRHALNASAQYWMTSTYDPLKYEPSNDVPSRTEATSVPILPTPWVQMGWGYVGPDLASEIVSILLGQKSTPEKPSEAKLYMDLVYQLRESYWNSQPA